MRTFVLRCRDRVVRRFRRWLVESFEVRGIPVAVVNARPDVQTSAVVQRLDEALGLIERYQLPRFRHLQRDLREIRVMPYPCRGAYFSRGHVCLTELTFVGRGEFSAAQVAASILHEATHARIDRRGVRSEDMARIERICRRAELAFGEALPTTLGAPVIERARDSIALADDEVAPTVDWNEAHLRRDIAELEAMQFPGWITRRLVALRRRRARGATTR